MPVELTNSIGMKLVLIPPGEFMMGSSPEAIVDSAGHEMSERPPLRVRIMKPFYLGLHEVTRDTFRQFVEDQPYRTEGERDGQGSYGFTGERWEMKPEWSWQHPGFPQNGQHPVVHVSWNDAVAFCGWLSTKEGRTYRLPTEAQWEYACRAGTTTPWVSGRNPDDVTLVANIADSTLHGTFELLWAVSTSDGYVFTSPVGQFSANPFGLRDMYGNVAEWCQDWFDAAYYAHSPSDDPVGPPGGSFRVVRGGSSHNHAASPGQHSVAGLHRSTEIAGPASASPSTWRRRSSRRRKASERGTSPLGRSQLRNPGHCRVPPLNAAYQ